MALFRMISTALTIAACTYGAVSALPAQTLPAQGSKIENPHIIPDPTPRPIDVRQKYDQDPAAKRKMEQAVAVKNQLRQQRVVSDTQKLFLLASQLKVAIEQHVQNGTPYPESLKAEEIEKLAKTVKEKMRSE